MAPKIGILLPVRKDSERVTDKMLRPFGTSSLFEIYLDKLEAFKPQVTVAAHEQEFIDIADARGFSWLRRTWESAHAEDLRTIHGYVSELDHDWFLCTNACLPLIGIETLRGALSHLEDSLCLNPQYNGFLSVVSDTQLLWDHDGNLLTPDACLLNTKLMKPHRKCISAFGAWSRKRLLDTGVIWSFRKNDPELYEVATAESYDIDTPENFEHVEWLWNRRNASS